MKYFPHPTTRKRMRIPLIIAADPGAERGYAVIDPDRERARRTIDAPHVVAMGSGLEQIVDRLPPGILDGRPVWAVTEFQYTQRITTGEISADAIVKLAFRAGYILRDMIDIFGAEEAFAAVPGRWKPEIYGTAGTKRKDIFTNRLIRELMPDELKVLVSFEEKEGKYIDDIVDAIGIGWALWRVANRAPAQWREWRCDPERIIPYNPPVGSRKKMFHTATKFTRTTFRPKEIVR